MAREATDAEAIRRSLEQPEAFVAVFERHHGAVHRHLRRVVGEGLADELAAEAFARAFRARARFEPHHDSARPWLFGIAANLLREHRRAEVRRLRALERLAGAAPREAAPEAASLDPALAAALRRLAPRDREALLLHAWAELSYEEVAEALGVPVGTVRSRLHRARRLLREDLGRDRFPRPAMGEANA
jgi:RNA polymerase sigma-70 factor (ECF subfamily)